MEHAITQFVALETHVDYEKYLLNKSNYANTIKNLQTHSQSYCLLNVNLWMLP